MSASCCVIIFMELWKCFKNNILLIKQNLFNFGSCLAFKFLITHSVTFVDKADFQFPMRILCKVCVMCTLPHLPRVMLVLLKPPLPPPTTPPHPTPARLTQEKWVLRLRNWKSHNAWSARRVLDVWTASIQLREPRHGDSQIGWHPSPPAWKVWLCCKTEWTFVSSDIP